MVAAAIVGVLAVMVGKKAVVLRVSLAVNNY